MRRRSWFLAFAPSGLSPAEMCGLFTAHCVRSLIPTLSRMACTTMTHLPPPGFNCSMATGWGTRASRFSSACAHCISHGDILLMRFCLLLPTEREPHLYVGDFSLALSRLRRFRGLAACAFALAGGFSFQRASPLVSPRPLRLRITCDTYGNQCKQSAAPSPQAPYFNDFSQSAPNFHAWELAFLGEARHVRHLTRGSDARNAHTRDAHTPAHAHAHTHTRQRPSARTRQRGRTHANAHTCTRTRHAHERTRVTHAHAGAPAPAYARDRELAALQRALQVRCTRGLSDVCRSERYAGRGFA